MGRYRFTAEKPLRIRYGFQNERWIGNGDEIDELDHPRLESCVSTGDLLDLQPPEPEPVPAPAPEPEPEVLSSGEPEVTMTGSTPAAEDQGDTPEPDDEKKPKKKRGRRG